MAQQETIPTAEKARTIFTGASDSHSAEKRGHASSERRNTPSKHAKGADLESNQIRSRTVQFKDAEASSFYRRIPRHEVLFPVTVCDANNVAVEGRVTDITEKGLRIEGIETEIYQNRSLLIRADEWSDIFPFVVDAQCRWTSVALDDETFTAGYEIVGINEAGLENIRSIIDRLAFREKWDTSATPDSDDTRSSNTVPTEEIKDDDIRLKTTRDESLGSPDPPDRPTVPFFTLLREHLRSPIVRISGIVMLSLVASAILFIYGFRGSLDLALVAAARDGSVDLVKVLLQQGADINAQTPKGTTALMWASHNGDAKTARLLIMKGADINVSDRNGDTALIFGSLSGNKDVVALLIKHGADAQVKDAFGQTALSWSKRKGHHDVTALLANYGNRKIGML